jgi:hypothetical protein
MPCRFLQHDEFPLESAPSPIKSAVFVDIGFEILGPTPEKCLKRNTASGIECADDSHRRYTLNSRQVTRLLQNESSFKWSHAVSRRNTHADMDIHLPGY